MEAPRFTLPLIRTRQGLLVDGFSDSEIRDGLKAGTLVRVRRGCYRDGPTDSDGAPRTDLAETAAAVAAVAARAEDTVFSHATAAALWELPFLGELPTTIHVTVPRTAHGIGGPGCTITLANSFPARSWSTGASASRHWLVRWWTWLDRTGSAREW